MAIVIVRSGKPVQPKGPSRKESIALRRKAGRMLLAGHSPTEVARKLDISPNTARKWKSILDNGGLEVLSQIDKGGARSFFTVERKDRLEQELLKDPGAHDLPPGKWTLDLVSALIDKLFQKKKDAKSVSRLLGRMDLDMRHINFRVEQAARRRARQPETE